MDQARLHWYLLALALVSNAHGGNSSVPTNPHVAVDAEVIEADEYNDVHTTVFGELSNIGRANIITDGVGNDELQADAVTSDKIADGTIVSADFASTTGVLSEMVIDNETAVDTSTTDIQFIDGTITSTDGEASPLSCTITVDSTSSKIEVIGTVMTSFNAGVGVFFLVRGTTVLKVFMNDAMGSPNEYDSVPIYFAETGVAAGSATYTLRYGSNTGGVTVYINGDSGGEEYSTNLKSSLVVKEYK